MNVMKVLWFSLSPCGSLRRNKVQRVIQGWMISLEDELKKRPDIELSVAFFAEQKEEPFVFDGVRYYPMYHPKASTGIGRVLDRFKSVEATDRKLLPMMLDVVRNANPDLIHIHGTEERFGLIQDEVKEVPIVFSIQGLIAPYAEKFFSGFPDKDIRRYESLSEKLRKATSRDLYKVFVSRGKRETGYLNKARYVLGRTFWDREITGMLNADRTYYVVDEILRAPFYQVQWNKASFSDKPFQIVSTISGGIYKGYETVLKTASLLRQNTALQFEWIIAGYDEHDKWVRIAEKYTGIKSSDVNIRLMGRLDAGQLAATLAGSDVYVHMSHIENSPNSVCEAMLVGMPVIASYTGGTGSMLEHEKEGILVQDGDPYVYAGAIMEVHSHFDRAKTYGENARRRALQRHNPERIGNQLIEAYKAIMTDFH